MNVKPNFCSSLIDDLQIVTPLFANLKGVIAVLNCSKNKRIHVKEGQANVIIRLSERDVFRVLI